jgi:hypothetical protein
MPCIYLVICEVAKNSCPPPEKELEIKEKREAIRDLCYKLYGHYKLNINYLPKSYQ